MQGSHEGPPATRVAWRAQSRSCNTNGLVNRRDMVPSKTCNSKTEKFQDALSIL